MMPVLFKVFPKPSWIAVMASDGDILPIRPVISAASSSAMKVWVLVFITKKIMIAMPKNRPSSIWVSCDIFIPLSVLYHYCTRMGIPELKMPYDTVLVTSYRFSSASAKGDARHRQNRRSVVQRMKSYKRCAPCVERNREK